MFPQQNSVTVPYLCSPIYMFKPSQPRKYQSPNNTILRPWNEFRCIHPFHISLKLLCCPLQHTRLNSRPVIQLNCWHKYWLYSLSKKCFVLTDKSQRNTQQWPHNEKLQLSRLPSLTELLTMASARTSWIINTIPSYVVIISYAITSLQFS